MKIKIILLITAVIAGLVVNTEADVVNVNPSMNTDQINQVISASEPNDTIVFEDGSYNVGPYPWNYYNLLPNRDYTFGDVIISGTGLEHGALFVIINEGNINIIADNMTLRKSNVGIWIGDVPYDNINISGVNFYVYEDGIVIEDREHVSPLEEAAVKVSYCISDGGKRLLNFAYIGDAHETSPYASITNCTLIDLTSDDGSIDVPWYAFDDETLIMLGGDEIYGNVLIGCYALADPDTYQFYNSPSNIAYSDVDEPYLDGENCFIADPNDFLPDGITPRRDGRLNLGEGNYIGSIEPYHELPGNLNFDEVVDISDLAVVAGRFDGELTEVLLVASDWLMEEPTDPLGNPK